MPGTMAGIRRDKGSGEQPRWLISQLRWRARYIDSEGKRRSVYSTIPGRAGARRQPDGIRRSGAPSLGSSTIHASRRGSPRALAGRGRSAQASALELGALSRHHPRAAPADSGTNPARLARAGARRAGVRRARGTTRGNDQPRSRADHRDPRPLGSRHQIRPCRPPPRAGPGRRLAAHRAQPGERHRPAAAEPTGDASAHHQRGAPLPRRRPRPSAGSPLHPGPHIRHAAGRAARPALARRRLGDAPDLRPPHPGPDARALVAGRPEDRQERALRHAHRPDDRPAPRPPCPPGGAAAGHRPPDDRRRLRLLRRRRRAAVGPSHHPASSGRSCAGPNCRRSASTTCATPSPPCSWRPAPTRRSCPRCSATRTSPSLSTDTATPCRLCRPRPWAASMRSWADRHSTPPKRSQKRRRRSRRCGSTRSLAPPQPEACTGIRVLIRVLWAVDGQRRGPI